MKTLTFEEFLASDEIGASVLREKIASDPSCESHLSLAYKCALMVAARAAFDWHLKRALGQSIPASEAQS